MNPSTKAFLFWTPRILCIFFAMLLSLFALDVFEESAGFWRTILALLIHLVPVYLVVIALVVAWRWEWVGAALFAALALAQLLWAWDRFHRNPEGCGLAGAGTNHQQNVSLLEDGTVF